MSLTIIGIAIAFFILTEKSYPHKNNSFHDKKDREKIEENLRAEELLKWNKVILK